ncbi:gametogenetin-binding protein 2-like isoform X2 [Lytechinus variegatus]|uniref:gametogenetin-binding protein 2-like isoform X2 n=1 Tax=Lytechinus variegatus TaxID=7654 RepID=UPI001BB18CD6|nr:gametogenetin-binding protein 2-like isoform X2 [Lytechinus variegatus]
MRHRPCAALSHRCPELDCASAVRMENTAQLVAVCPPGSENIYQYLRRQMPLTTEGNTTMVVELPDLEPPLSACNHSKGQSKNQHAVIDSFRQKCSVLNRDELAAALMVPSKEMFGSSLQDVVTCVGCRRSMEEMFTRLRDKKHVHVLEPLVITPNSELSVTSCTLYDFRMLHNILYVQRDRQKQLLESLQKNKKRRCPLHSLDNHKIKQISVWIDVWEVMKKPCREEVTILSEKGLLQTTESYLQKHRFCTDCKAKVMTAFNILFGDVKPCSEKGYNPAVYEGLRLCREERHIHLSTDTDFVARLISRAEPDLHGVRRERHAKTIDIAQEEVLTCLGLHLFEKLQKIHQKLKAEERTWDLLLTFGKIKLRKSFEMALESKEGMSRLELVCEEITEADRAKREKKEQKKLKKKARKKNKSNASPETEKNLGQRSQVMKEVEVSIIPQERSCECDPANDLNDNTANLECSTCSLSQGDAVHHLSTYRTDNVDYSSGVECGEDCGQSSRDSSDIACSEGMCNHCDDDIMQGEDVDQCNGDDEICADCDVNQGNGDATVVNGRFKCNGGQPLPTTHCSHSEIQEDRGENSQIQKICQCANEDQLRRAVGWTMRLQDMLIEPESVLAEEEILISQEEIRDFRANHKSVHRQRQQLRAKLQQRFNRRFQGREPLCATDYRLGQLTIAVD